MRWLFLIVLSLNLAYIAWQMSLPNTASYANVPPLKNVQPIVLLNEQENAVTEKTETGDAAKTITQSVSQDESITVAETEIVEVEGALVNTGNAEAESVAEEKPVLVAKAVELSAAPATDEEKTILQAESCFTLGPFRDLDKLRSLTRDIKSYVVSADFRGREEKEQSLFWVYIEPEKNRNKAIKTGERLKAKKIKDFYLIRKGEKKNGLSLGHFKSKKGAYGLAKKVRKLGFDVTVEPVFKTYTIYWLDYRLVNGAKIPDSIFEKYMGATKKDEISRLSRDCGV